MISNQILQNTIEGYRFLKLVPARLTVSSNVEDNIIKIYYIEGEPIPDDEKVSYEVEYYYNNEIDNNNTANIPMTIPTHCHQCIFSLKITAEQIVVNINPPIERSGYIKPGDSAEVAKNITNKFKSPLQTPANTGKYQLLFVVLKKSDLSLCK